MIVVSHATFQIALERGVPARRMTIISNGVTDFFGTDTSRSDLREFVGRTLPSDITILFSAGRLVKRKGTAWFIKHVMPNVPENFVYLIAGVGPERKRIMRLIRQLRLESRIYMLGRVLDGELGVLFHTAHAFVMPNIPVASDREGFGIVALEAASCGLPVIAAGIEGIPDAIQNGKNGFLLPSGDADIWIQRLPILVDQGQKMRSAIRAYTLAHFDWSRIAKSYIQVFQNVLKTAA
ncbi:MAG: hypothetical protein A3G01_00465 [Candidatus Kerfeldbacteria bacterium RIFCSPLOWO2_12_FULL_43_9]|nr:MAG: hypothetical protein A3G01_00465 [Candidatus Kerfeldbacteria bacterium RIFCSPLOWO2_12_FULL_43_9]